MKIYTFDFDEIEDQGGDEAVVHVEHAQAFQTRARQSRADAGQFRRKDRGEAEDQQVVGDGQDKVGHGAPLIGLLRQSGAINLRCK